MNQEYSHNHKHQESFIIHQHRCIAVSSIPRYFSNMICAFILYFLGTQGHPYQYVSTCTPSQYGTISSVQPSSTPTRLDYWYRLHLIKLNLLQSSTLPTICTSWSTCAGTVYAFIWTPKSTSAISWKFSSTGTSSLYCTSKSISKINIHKTLTNTPVVYQMFKMHICLSST